MKKLLSVAALALTISLSAAEKTFQWDAVPKAPETFRDFPNAKKKWSLEKDSEKMQTILNEIKRLRSAKAETVYAFPAAKDFPGVPPDGTPAVTREIKIDPAATGWISTGLYAYPGEPLTITFPEKTEFKNGKRRVYRVLVGCHTDKLSMGRHKTWSRLPEISYSWEVSAPSTRVTSPMGGLIYIDVMQASDTLAPFTVKVGNAAAAPMFVRGKTSMDEWRKMLTEHPAPWGELVGKRGILSFPLADLREIKDPELILVHLDSGMMAQDWLIAWDVTAPQRLRTPMRLVTDRQISAGSGHSGYPAMGLASWSRSFKDMSFIKKGSWGLWHEFGHNHQQGAYRLPGMGEVTVNIFSLVALAKAHEIDLWDSWGGFKNRARDLKNYFASDSTYAQMGSAHGLRLIFWAEMIEAFGFEPFREMSIQFAKNGFNGRAKDEVKWGWVMTTLSKATGKSLAKFFEIWRISVTDESKAAVKDLPIWLPYPEYPQKK